MRSSGLPPLESTGLGVPLGPWIPIGRYDRLREAIRNRLPAPPGHFEHAVAASVGWSGLGYRARSASEHKEAFSQLFQVEPAASHEQRYQQDSHFFGFIVNATAAAESLVYAIHAVALGVDGVPLTDGLLKRTRHEMINAIQAVPQFEVLGRCLKALMKVAVPLFEMRDTVLHRGRLPRNHFVGGEYHGKMTLARNPKSAPEKWENNFVFGIDSCDAYAAWLAGFISEMVAHMEQALGIVDRPS